MERELGLLVFPENCKEGIDSSFLENAICNFSDPSIGDVPDAEGVHAAVGPISKMFVPWNDRSVHFGDSVYEVIAVNEGTPFLLREHLDRMKFSMAEMKFSLSEKELDDIVFRRIGNWCHWLTKLSNLISNCIIYIQVSRTIAPFRAHPFPLNSSDPAVYMMIKKKPFPVEIFFEGASVNLSVDERHHRCDLKTTNLLGNMFGEEQAARRRDVDPRCFETVFYRLPYGMDVSLGEENHKDGIITEGCAATVFAVFDGELWTHPEGHYVLPGVTKIWIRRQAMKLGIKIREERFSVDRMLNDASEVILTGTTTGVMPVVKCYMVEEDGKEYVINDGHPGPVQHSLRNLYIH